MDPTRTRRPGQHGPRLSRQRVIRAIAQRFGLDGDHALADLAARGEDRAAERHRRAEVSRQRAIHAYTIYWHYLWEGLTEPDPGGYRFPPVDIPDELRDRPQSSRRNRHSPGDLARWAYEFRQLGMSWEEVALAEARRAERSQEAGAVLVPSAQSALAAAIEAGDDTEVDYQRAQLALIRQRAFPKRTFATTYADAEAAIRQAVQRHRHIWELAERNRAAT